MSEDQEAYSCTHDITAAVRDDNGKPWTRVIEFGTPAQWARLNLLYRMLCEVCYGHGRLTLVFFNGKLVGSEISSKPPLPEN